jgi:hypothetical protein
MTRIRFKPAATALAATVIALVCVASAGASRAPSSKQQKAIANAVLATKVAGLNQVPKSHYRVTGVRISSVSSSWSKAEVVARPGFQSTFQNAIVVAVRLAGTSQWVVVDLGSADVGCGIAPNKVLADLFSTKTPCPGGSGIG